VARHPPRPHFTDYAKPLCTGFTPRAGDRKFGDDRSILGGPAWLAGEPVMVIGQEKGHDTQARIAHNFGMALPEGYRKAVRLMEMADRFGLAVISFIDTPGAYPGIGAEERGQSEAIARSIDCCLGLGVPSIAVIIGEGGSGGAVAIATASRVLMLEHAIYSVISPEGAASILWRDSNKAEDAAVALKITAADLLQLKVIDEIVPEPMGGAHRDAEQAMAATGLAITASLAGLKGMGPDETRRHRRDKFLAIGRAI
jgi:acetyl-CoA carboxylase carboxyl transferase subunit alpha